MCVCRRRGLKVNADKSKGMALGGKEGLKCEVCVDGIRLENVSEFKYVGSVLDESGTDGAECSRKVASRRKGAGALRSLVNVRSIQLECARLLHESLLVPVLRYGGRRRGLGLRLYRWTTSEVCWLSGESIKSRMHG